MNSEINKNELMILIDKITVEGKNNDTIMNEINEQFYLINDYDGISLTGALSKLSSDARVINANLTSLAKVMHNYIDGLVLFDKYNSDNAKDGVTPGNFSSEMAIANGDETLGDYNFNKPSKEDNVSNTNTSNNNVKPIGPSSNTSIKGDTGSSKPSTTPIKDTTTSGGNGNADVIKSDKDVDTKVDNTTDAKTEEVKTDENKQDNKPVVDKNDNAVSDANHTYPVGGNSNQSHTNNNNKNDNNTGSSTVIPDNNEDSIPNNGTEQDDTIITDTDNTDNDIENTDVNKPDDTVIDTTVPPVTPPKKDKSNLTSTIFITGGVAAAAAGAVYAGNKYIKKAKENDSIEENDEDEDDGKEI